MSEPMTQEDLRDYMLNVWRSTTGHGLSAQMTDGQTALLNAMLNGIAAGILVGGAGGTVVSRIQTDVLTGTGTAFELTYAPMSSFVLAVLNGWIVDAATVDGKTITLSQAKAAGDSLVVHYEYLGG